MSGRIEGMNWILICQLIIMFFVFSCIGWLIEVILKFIQYHRFINRGFLIGPYCPIYGSGVVVVTVLAGGLIGRKGTVSEIFWAGYVLCGILEYFTSWYMETRFHARWWDYSEKPMNLHGRIWVGNLLLFGAASVLIVCWIDPVYFALVEKLRPFWLYFSAGAVACIVMADYIASHVLMGLVRREIDTQKGDNTEEISAGVHELLRNRGLLFRRIEQAYPNLHTRPLWLTKQLRQAQKDYKEAKRSVEELLKTGKAGRKVLAEDAAWKERLEHVREAERRARRRLQELQKKQMHHKKEDEESGL